MKKTCLTDREYVNTVIRPRDRNVHKGDCGRILIVAGSEQMPGAAVLCARAAFRTGSGLVNVSISSKAFNVIQTAIPEAICLNRSSAYVDYNSFDAIALGPGMGRNHASYMVLKDIITNYRGPLVIDADGLTLIADNDAFEDLKCSPANIVLTPHMGEATRLLGYDGSHMPEGMDRNEIALRIYQKTGAVTVLKGADSLIATDSRMTYTNTTGNPGMATAGAGDVLTGVIVSLMGQKYKAEEAARLGVYIHGLAGDIAGAAVGEWGIMAGDIADGVSRAIADILNKMRD